MKSNWKNLKESRCPVCGNLIERKGAEDYRCGKCFFFCRYDRAMQIIENIRIGEEIKKREERTDDFIKSKGKIPEKL